MGGCLDGGEADVETSACVHCNQNDGTKMYMGSLYCGTCYTEVMKSRRASINRLGAQFDGSRTYDDVKSSPTRPKSEDEEEDDDDEDEEDENEGSSD